MVSCKDTKLRLFKFDLTLDPNGDGGYLVPNDLEGIEACFSPGVDKISEFELDCLNYGMKIYMPDKSVEKPNLNLSEGAYSFIDNFLIFKELFFVTYETRSYKPTFVCIYTQTTVVEWIRDWALRPQK